MHVSVMLPGGPINSPSLSRIRWFVLSIFLACLGQCKANEEPADDRVGKSGSAAHCVSSNPSWPAGNGADSDAIWIKGDPKTSIARVRIRASDLPPEARNDSNPAHWSLRIRSSAGAVDVALGDPMKAAVLPFQSNSHPSSVEHVYFQTLVDASPIPQTLEVSYPQAGWSKALKIRPSQALDIPIALVRTQKGPSFSTCSGGDVAEALRESEAFKRVRSLCGVHLSPAVERCVQHPDPVEIAQSVDCEDSATLRKLAADRSGAAEPQIYCQFETAEGKRSIEDVFQFLGAEDRRLRLVMGDSFRKVARGCQLYEYRGIQNYKRSVWTYDGLRMDVVNHINGQLQKPARPELLRDRSNDCGLSFASVHWDADADIKKTANRAMHELGHMFGLSHPEDTATPLDGCYENIMSPTSSSDPECPDRGVHLTQAQCLLMAIDIRGYGRVPSE